MNAFQEMISTDSFPVYTLFIDLDPTQVDVNVHPTKQEIKFEDEKIVYAFVQAAIKHALAQFSITPTLDFDLDASIQQLSSIQQPFTEEKKSAVASTSIFKTFTQKHQAHFIESNQKAELKHWQDSTEENRQSEEFLNTHNTVPPSAGQALTTHHPPLTIQEDTELTQLQNTYILVPSSRGFLLVHQQAAHERILYERLTQAVQGKPVATQRSLFPVTIELAASDAAVLGELMTDLHHLGYMIEPFGNNTFVIQGTPADVEQGDEKNIIDGLLEQYKHFNNEMKFSKREGLVRSAAWQQSIKAGKKLGEKEMRMLVENLFSCEQSNSTPGGKPTYLEFRQEQLERMFGKG
jgi:DNA mismatch repair protein MutL